MTSPAVLHLGVHGPDVTVDARAATRAGKPSLQVADTACDELAGS